MLNLSSDQIQSGFPSNKLTGLVFMLLMTGFLFSRCGEGGNESKDDHASAELMMAQMCISCHNPTSGKDQRIGPPFIAVRDAYLAVHPDKEGFVDAIAKFSAYPSKDHALMPAEVERFGLMPPMGYSMEKVRAIAAYLYEVVPTSPDWYGESNAQTSENGGNATASSEDPYLKIAMATKGELGKNLMNAIQNFGTAGAVDFCNTRAIPITDSMSTLHQVKIKRVSDKPRNPENLASAEEKEIIDAFKVQFAKSGKTEPVLKEQGNNVFAYYSIETNAMCLQCHGVRGKDIESKTMDVILSKYPGDLATGYSVDQIRGMWVIEASRSK
jgi:mono/diheme cytochrome c family protein